MEQRRAAGDQQEDRQDEDLAGGGERHDARERRDDEVHGEVGDRPPVGRIELLQERRAVVVRQDVNARQMIGIVEERQRLDRQDR